MRRRSLLVLTLAGVAGCGSPGVAEPLPSAGGEPDLGWPDRSPDFGHGFCFTMVRGIDPYRLIKRLGGDELERAEWHRLVGPGDGESGVRTRFFAGIARVSTDWVVIVEDNGAMGVTKEVVEPLSGDGGEVVSYRGGGGRSGRLMMFRDGDLLLDLDTARPAAVAGDVPVELRSDLQAAGLVGGTGVIEPTGSALAFVAARTGVALTYGLLKERTYLLVTVPQP